MPEIGSQADAPVEFQIRWTHSQGMQLPPYRALTKVRGRCTVWDRPGARIAQVPAGGADRSGQVDGERRRQNDRGMGTFNRTGAAAPDRRADGTPCRSRVSSDDQLTHEEAVTESTG